MGHPVGTVSRQTETGANRGTGLVTSSQTVGQTTVLIRKFDKRSDDPTCLFSQVAQYLMLAPKAAGNLAAIGYCFTKSILREHTYITSIEFLLIWTPSPHVNI